MPTERFGKVRRLLRDGLAVVVNREPFTIKLLYDSSTFVQQITLGVDAGYEFIGLSATTTTKELFSAEVRLRTDIVKLLAARRESRRARRNRLRYRAPRFNNRHHAKFSPSTEQRINSHLAAISKVCSILPIAKTVIEVAQFDTQKIKNPSIEGEAYQQGEQLGFWNVREYVLVRDMHQCQYCKGKSKDKVLNVHHIESRLTGGNSPANLITLCETCHKAYHKGEIKLSAKRSFKSLRSAAAMSVFRWELYNRAARLWSNVSLTFGYITKHSRIVNGLSKAHSIDARCISGNPLAKPCSVEYKLRQHRRHCRQIHTAHILSGGRRKRNQAPYLVKGFRLYDKVMYNGIECFVFGRRSSGSFDIRLIDGQKVHAGISYKKLTFVQSSKRYLITTNKRQNAIPLASKEASFLA